MNQHVSQYDKIFRRSIIEKIQFHSAVKVLTGKATFTRTWQATWQMHHKIETQEHNKSVYTEARVLAADAHRGTHAHSRCKQRHTCSQQMHTEAHMFTADAWWLWAWASPGSNLVLKLTCCTAQAVTSNFLGKIPTSETADTWIICRSHTQQLPAM